MRASSLLLMLSLTVSSPLLADDGAASIAAGGIVVMKQEPRIVMAKEVLNISATKVVVNYDFRNDSSDDITTEVAFPIPAYELNIDGASPDKQGFDDFKLWIDRQPTKFITATRAFVGERDITDSLSKLHVDAGSFGHFVWNNDANSHKYGPNYLDLDRLSKLQLARLSQEKIISNVDEHEPLWRVEKKYHWSQTFPAHAVVHIRHEYTPVIGNTNSASYGLLQAKEDPDSAKELATICIDPALRRTLLKHVGDAKTSVPVFFVDFILTTANTWKTPIEDFTLNVERFQAKGADQSFVSFCWDGSIQKIDPNNFTMHVNNLIPKKELRIGYIQVFTDKVN